MHNKRICYSHTICQSYDGHAGIKERTSMVSNTTSIHLTVCINLNLTSSARLRLLSLSSPEGQDPWQAQIATWLIFLLSLLLLLPPDLQPCPFIYCCFSLFQHDLFKKDLPSVFSCLMSSPSCSRACCHCTRSWSPRHSRPCRCSTTFHSRTMRKHPYLWYQYLHCCTAQCWRKCRFYGNQF